jgi:TetR/AcrR family transcriptional regulator of autoinduction and epiphytic fitness
MAPGAQARPYHSPARDESARRTRRAIRDAATKLFLARGFARTSIDSIAAAAGVARRTVQLAYPTKGDLLDDIVNVALAGEDTGVPLTKRQWFVDVLGMQDPLAALRALAVRTAEIHARTARIHDLALAAAAGDHTLARMGKRGQASRRNIWQIQALAMHAKGWLRQGIDADTATDILWVLSSPQNYRLLVVERGWDQAAYCDWFVGAAATVLKELELIRSARRRGKTGSAKERQR